ncbi:MAG: hypothetical protein ACRDQG_14070, partial [Pseudonocardiaceae bacterium]
MTLSVFLAVTAVVIFLLVIIVRRRQQTKRFEQEARDALAELRGPPPRPRLSVVTTLPPLPKPIRRFGPRRAGVSVLCAMAAVLTVALISAPRRPIKAAPSVPSRPTVTTSTAPPTTVRPTSIKESTPRAEP